MHPAFLSKLPALLAGALLPLALAGGAHAEKITGPFAYPTGRLDAEHLPVQIGRIGLGMESALVNELLGRASYKDEAGWHYWFSQRFLRNKRGLQELELNWLAVHYDDDGLVDKTFSSQVTNL